MKNIRTNAVIATTASTPTAGVVPSASLLFNSIPTQGNTVTVGADVYEFRDSTPPLGGTAGRIWIYKGASADAAAINFRTAVNGTVSAPTVTRIVQDPTAGTNTELVTAALLGGVGSRVTVFASAGIGNGSFLGDTANLSVASYGVAVAETLTDPLSVWAVPNAGIDGSTLNMGEAAGDTYVSVTSCQLSASAIAAGYISIFVPFRIKKAFCINLARPQNEQLLVSEDNYVTLTLAGGATPNNQGGDQIVFMIFGDPLKIIYNI